MKKYKIALCYDFDGTLSPGDMQEYDFMKKIGMRPTEFWKKSEQYIKEHNADAVLSYMRLMLEEAQKKNVSFTKQDLEEYGRTIPLYAGVDTWFDRINAYAKTKNLITEHYIISSGLKEMITGNPISRYFKMIYASSFMYDENGNAKWPAVALNYTTKTQFIFRINKGCLELTDPEINSYIPDNKRSIPLSRMIYIGDGATDIPCMKLVKSNNGFAVAVYNPCDKRAQEQANRLKHESRASFYAPANYEPGSRMEEILQTIIDKIALDIKMEALKKGKQKLSFL